MKRVIYRYVGNVPMLMKEVDGVRDSIIKPGQFIGRAAFDRLGPALTIRQEVWVPRQGKLKLDKPDIPPQLGEFVERAVLAQKAVDKILKDPIVEVPKEGTLMSWSISDSRLLSGVSASEAVSIIAADTNLPPFIKGYIQNGISGLVTYHGGNSDAVKVKITGHGHLCTGEGSYEVTSATIEVSPV